MNSNSKSSWLSGLKKKAASIASDFAGLSAEDKSGGNDVSTLNTTVSPAPMKRDLVRQKVSSSLTTALGDRRHEWNIAVNGSDSCYLQIVVNQNEDQDNHVSLLVDLPFINGGNLTHLKSLGFRINKDLNSPDYYNADKDFLVLPTVDGIGDFVNQIIEILQLIQRDLDGVTEVDAYILNETSLFIEKSTGPSEIQNPDSLLITAPALNEIASRLGVKIWKTVSGTFQFIEVGAREDRWIFKVDPSTDSAIENGVRSLGLPSYQGRCTWGSKHVSEGIYVPVLIACFGNKDKALVVILHWNDLWEHDAAVNALSAHFKLFHFLTPHVTYMPPIMLWDGKSGPLELMGYRFGATNTPSFGMMPLTNAFEGIRKIGMRWAEASHAAADVGTIRTARFLPDFFSSTLEEGWFNE
jgi:hypothetical protein